MFECENRWRSKTKMWHAKWFIHVSQSYWHTLRIYEDKKYETNRTIIPCTNAAFPFLHKTSLWRKHQSEGYNQPCEFQSDILVLVLRSNEIDTSTTVHHVVVYCSVWCYSSSSHFVWCHHPSRLPCLMRERTLLSRYTSTHLSANEKRSLSLIEWSSSSCCTLLIDLNASVAKTIGGQLLCGRLSVLLLRQ